MTPFKHSPHGWHGKANRNFRVRGFTLIELMIVIVILAIVVTMAAPSFMAMLDKRRLAGAATDVLGIMNQGRSQAITLNRNVVAHFSTSANGWCVGITDKATCDCAAAEGAAEACTVDLPPGAASSPALIRPVIDSSKHPGITLTIPNGTSVEFRASNGLLLTPAVQNLTTTSSHSGRSMRVRVSAIGRADVCGVGETYPGGVAAC